MYVTIRYSMDIKDFKAGTWHEGYRYRYFLPENINHSFTWNDASLSELLELASLRLGELNSFSRLVPDTDMFIMMHIFKEAVVSSRIEGTRTNMEEALVNETDVNPEKRDDWQEVQNYVSAMNSAIEQLQELPLSNRLVRNIHQVLLSSVRGMHKSPGEFRSSQNWIGGASLTDAVFVPPVHTEVPGLMGDLELFLNNREIHIPHLARIAIAHYQFETIHPFLDGNGRMGRLLITLYLVSAGILERPLLYLSDYFEKHKTLYYDNLMVVRMKNDLSQWIRFFLVGVSQTAMNATATLQQIIQLKNRIEKERIVKMGKRVPIAHELQNGLFRKPLVTVKDIQQITGLSPKAAGDLAKIFTENNILVESTGYQRNRVFVFREYLRLFT